MTGIRVRALTATGMAAAAVIATLGGVAAPADAAETKSLKISGELEIAPDLEILEIKAEGTTDAEGKTTGTYVATLLAGDDDNPPLPFKVKGPITCIYTEGNTASLVYPITGTEPNLVPPAPLKDVLAVQITVRKGDENTVGGVNGPAPTHSFRGCNPGGATPYEFDGGDIEIN